ncbi:unnamed protein product [Rotaria sp. Silwood1]|nr:unnamed protein product [Rotaria sp. Silwood1]CAF3478194.1 unnamed protein product [Rotaria sp. Silwood1]
MVNAYSFDGIIVLVLLTICTCGYMRRVSKLREWFLSEKKGFASIFFIKRQLLVLVFLLLLRSHVLL